MRQGTRYGEKLISSEVVQQLNSSHRQRINHENSAERTDETTRSASSTPDPINRAKARFRADHFGGSRQLPYPLSVQYVTSAIVILQGVD